MNTATQPYDSWTRWFAWRPVLVENKLRWLTTVERTRRYPETTILHPGGLPSVGAVWVYRDPINA